MDTPTNTTEVSQEKERKRSPVLIIILVLLLLLVVCCIIGAVICRGSVRLPDLLDRLSEYVLDPDSDFGDIWSLVNGDEYIPDLDIIKTVYPGDGIVPGSGTNLCEGLSGNFEMQVLVGPAAAVELEPFGIGSIPFSVDFDQGMYLVQGEGTIDYEDVLEEVWGTYSVFFDMDGVIDGICTQGDEGGVLDITIELIGDQVFIVDSPGLQEEYPKSFEHQFDYSFPVVDGATESGEGWALILHLD